MPDGTVLAFDFGTRRIGVAIGEMMLRRARPLGTIAGEASAARFAAIGALIAEWQPTRLVVGLPLAADGAEHEMTARCRRFARQLEGRFGLPVSLADERYTSVAAEEALAAAGQDWRRRRTQVDAAAAALFLQDWFDHETP